MSDSEKNLDSEGWSEIDKIKRQMRCPAKRKATGAPRRKSRFSIQDPLTEKLSDPAELLEMPNLSPEYIETLISEEEETEEGNAELCFKWLAKYALLANTQICQFCLENMSLIKDSRIDMYSWRCAQCRQKKGAASSHRFAIRHGSFFAETDSDPDWAYGQENVNRSQRIARKKAVANSRAPDFVVHRAVQGGSGTKPLQNGKCMPVLTQNVPFGHQRRVAGAIKSPTLLQPQFNSLRAIIKHLEQPGEHEFLLKAGLIKLIPCPIKQFSVPSPSQRFFISQIEIRDEIVACSGGFRRLIESVSDQTLLQLYKIFQQSWLINGEDDYVKLGQVLRVLWNMLSDTTRLMWEFLAREDAVSSRPALPPRNLLVKEVTPEKNTPMESEMLEHNTNGAIRTKNEELTEVGCELMAHMPVSEQSFIANGLPSMKPGSLGLNCSICNDKEVLMYTFTEIVRHYTSTHFVGLHYGCHLCGSFFQTVGALNKHCCKQFSEYLLQLLISQSSKGNALEMKCCFFYLACSDCGLCVPISLKNDTVGQVANFQRQWVQLINIMNVHNAKNLVPIIVYLPEIPNSELKELTFKVTPSICMKDLPWTCDECNIECFDSPMECEEHFRIFHPSDKFLCRQCGEIFGTRPFFMSHCLQHLPSSFALADYLTTQCRFYPPARDSCCSLKLGKQNIVPVGGIGKITSVKSEDYVDPFENVVFSKMRLTREIKRFTLDEQRKKRKESGNDPDYEEEPLTNERLPLPDLGYEHLQFETREELDSVSDQFQLAEYFERNEEATEFLKSVSTHLIEDPMVIRKLKVNDYVFRKGDKVNFSMRYQNGFASLWTQQFSCTVVLPISQDLSHMKFDTMAISKNDRIYLCHCGTICSGVEAANHAKICFYDTKNNEIDMDFADKVNCMESTCSVLSLRFHLLDRHLKFGLYEGVNGTKNDMSEIHSRSSIYRAYTTRMFDSAFGLKPDGLLLRKGLPNRPIQLPGYQGFNQNVIIRPSESVNNMEIKPFRIVTVAANRNLYYCNLCSFQSSAYKHCPIHLTSHHAHPCDACGAVFLKKANLELHKLQSCASSRSNESRAILRACCPLCGLQEQIHPVVHHLIELHYPHIRYHRLDGTMHPVISSIIKSNFAEETKIVDLDLNLQSDNSPPKDKNETTIIPEIVRRLVKETTISLGEVWDENIVESTEEGFNDNECMILESTQKPVGPLLQLPREENSASFSTSATSNYYEEDDTNELGDLSCISVVAPSQKKVYEANSDDELAVIAEVEHPAGTLPSVIASSTRPNRIKCSKCSDRFMTEKSLQHHLATAHTFDAGGTILEDFGIPQKVPVFICRSCCVAFETTVQLQKHQRQHIGSNQINCNKCSMIAYNSQLMNLHKSAHDDGRLTFVCPRCRSAFKTDSELYGHLHDKHDVELLYFCKLCSIASTNGILIAEHIVTRKCLPKYQSPKFTENNFGVVPACILHYNPLNPKQYSQMQHQKSITTVEPSLCNHRTFVAPSHAVVACLDCNCLMNIATFIASQEARNGRSEDIQYTLITAPHVLLPQRKMINLITRMGTATKSSTLSLPGPYLTFQHNTPSISRISSYHNSITPRNPNPIQPHAAIHKPTTSLAYPPRRNASATVQISTKEKSDLAAVLDGMIAINNGGQAAPNHDGRLLRKQTNNGAPNNTKKSYLGEIILSDDEAESSDRAQMNKKSFKRSENRLNHPCNVCHKLLSNQSLLQLHELHTNGHNFFCLDCPISLSDEQAAVEHYFKVHINKMPIINNKTSGFKSLCFDLKCPFNGCKFQCESLAALRRHLETHELPHKSSHCQTRFLTQENCESHDGEHEKMEAAGIEANCCLLCGTVDVWSKRLPNFSVPITHMAIHGLRKFFMCRDCSVCFKHDALGKKLAGHFESHHTQEVTGSTKHLQCKLCQTQILKAELAAHAKEKHYVHGFKKRARAAEGQLIITAGTPLRMSLGMNQVYFQDDGSDID